MNKQLFYRIFQAAHLSKASNSRQKKMDANKVEGVGFGG
jgi:hypothetical protein